MNITHIPQQMSIEDFLNSKELMLVKFGAEWCGPCKAAIPLMEEFADKKAEKLGVKKVIDIDVDKASQLAAQFRIMSVPTFMVFKGGEPVDMTVGLDKIKDTANGGIAAFVEKHT